MAPVRLNLTALGCAPVRDTDTASKSTDRPVERSRNMSRRKLLGVVGGAAAAMTAVPTMQAVSGTFAGAAFEIVGDRKRLAMLIGGEEKWVIDTRRFAGTPKLDMVREGRTVRITLRNARYPGTNIPADFVCDIREGTLSRTMKLEFAFGGFVCTVPLEKWLTGKRRATSAVSLDQHVCKLGSSSNLILHGNAGAEFRPDWSFAINGERIAGFDAPDADLASDSVLLSLPNQTDVPLIQGTVSRRTHIMLDRGAHQWNMVPKVSDEKQWTFHTTPGEKPRPVFDSLKVEAAENTDGTQRHALLAEGKPDDEARLFVSPDPKMRGASGSFKMPLGNIRYGIAYDITRGDQKAVTGTFGNPQWLYTSNGEAMVGKGDGAEQFVLTTEGGKLVELMCAPALTHTRQQVSGAMSVPAKTSDGTKLFFVPHNDRIPKKPKGNEVFVNMDPGKLDDGDFVLTNNKNFFFVVRPEDLVWMGFMFSGVTQKGKTIKDLKYDVPAGAKKPTSSPIMVVLMQPQNIAEQAFYESDPQLDPGGSDALKMPPVKSRMSGGSRLVFKLKSSTVEFKLESLLQLCAESELIVSPYALMPVKASHGLNKYASSKYALNSGAKFAVNNYKINSAAKDVSAANASKGITANPLNRSAKFSQKANDSKALVGRASVQAKFAKKQYDITQKLNVELASSFAAKVALTKPTKAPEIFETAIEAPYRLFVSPNEYAAFKHAMSPVTHNQRTELWHMRLAVRRNNKVYEDDYEELRTITPIWSTDYDPEMLNHNDWVYKGINSERNPFRMSLDANDRNQIVHLSANHTLKGRYGYTPLPVSVERLMLSSLGAWMNTRGYWETPNALPISLTEWRHRAVMGRDSYVRVVYKGYLFPFGHKAVLIKVTERKFKPNPKGKMTAYMFQRFFIVVRQPEKTYGDSGLKTPSGEQYDLKMPLKSVRITTLVTPSLSKPENDDIAGKGRQAFWIRVGDYFKFHMVGTDEEGQSVEFTAPCAFIDKALAWEEATANAAKTAYNKPALNKIEMRGQKIAYASSSPEKPGDTTFETDRLVLDAEVPTAAAKSTTSLQDEDQPRYFPTMSQASVQLQSMKVLTGKAQATDFKFPSTYLQKGFDAVTNNGQVFAQLLSSNSLGFNGNSDKTGALAAPSMDMVGLSRLTGPVGGQSGDIAGSLGNMAAGNFDPKKFLGDAAKLFGCINLFDIIEAIAGAGGAPEFIPKFVTQALDTVQSFVHDIVSVQQAFDELKSKSPAELEQDVKDTVAGIQNWAQSQIDAKINEVKNTINALKTDMEAVISDVEKIVMTDIPDVFEQLLDDPTAAIATLKSDLEKLKTDLTKLINDLPPVGIATDIKRAIDKYGKMVIGVLDDIQKFLDFFQSPREIKITFDWKPQIKPFGFTADSPIFIPHDPYGFAIGAEVRARLEPNSGGVDITADVYCRLQNFSLNLIAPASIIQLNFNKIEFLIEPGKSPTVNVVMDPMEFLGPLSFLNALKDVIPLDGFSDPPAFDVSPSGITASFSLALPNLTIGVFAITNMSLNAGFNIPFIGESLSVNFSFCTRENPFHMTYMCIGGGGFVGITLTPAGLKILEASFELGACLSIDLGVASGSVSVMVGVYFKLENKSATEQECSLTGYLRIRGEVDVLGLISASIELYLAFTYEFSSGKLIGEASLEIEVKIFFFSFGVTIHCKRQLAGSKGDPTMEQLMSPYTSSTGEAVKPWDDYCMAFG